MRNAPLDRAVRRTTARLAALLLATQIAAACSILTPGDLDPARDEMRSRRAQWRAKNIQYYDFAVQTFCFCPEVRLLNVHVDGGVAVSATYADTGGPVPANLMDRVYTVDRLFEIVEQAIKQEADKLTVQYDSQFHYPIFIDIDYIRNAIDDEVRITASGLVQWTHPQRSFP